MDFLRFLLVLLLAVPAATAVVVAAFGSGRAALIRKICLGATIADAAIALILAVGLLDARSSVELVGDHVLALQGNDSIELKTFRPEIVPGPAADPHKTTWTLIDLGKAGTIQFYIGLDGLNIWLIVLTTILMVPAVLISWESITERVNEYYAWLMALGAGMLGVFMSFDIILFYVFFELTLVPLFFLIGLWGGPERRHASRKFFIYTLAGSLITLLGLLAVVVVCRGPENRLTFSIPELIAQVQPNLRQAADSAFHRLDENGDGKLDEKEMPYFLRRDLARWDTNNDGFIDSNEYRGYSIAHFQFWVFIAMMVGFAVKVPLFPVHTWLPLAHTEAPTAGSVLLAGVLLKLGTYGFLRLALPLTPEAAFSVGVPLIGTLSVIGISYGAFCAGAQDDIKKLVAYSSVSHLGFCTLGMFALNAAGITGSVLQMLNHGLSTGALFLLVGMLYERYHTRKMSDYSGMASRLGWLSAAFVFVCLSSVGLPGLNGFVGEALVFFGMFEVHPWFAVFGTAGIILGAWYLMTMLRNVFFGPLKEPAHDGPGHVTDLNAREIAALAPILTLCLLLGVYPQPVIDSIKPDVQIVVNILQSHAAGTHGIDPSE